mmetsp:Transcript_28683/g.62582  ORF Transcript_28683/g.62582 Transcript_28683/m.62582 type:complete len:412 (-) Transcript_28683:189-1424(-)|eukprot:CAMPEP_0170576064 /NCGR_PEP_ID=MMETSP0224-20130122/4193_1 /TAXON_ID=285029 /ORGANISM="Togula jolla, Strain CCCM 725" /LENGTH=411 /DNA_ID=CAMNT_0010898881 /DNA_START=58 /DNA_END=1293 /DNA_ORIENTATION=+
MPTLVQRANLESEERGAFHKKVVENVSIFDLTPFGVKYDRSQLAMRILGVIVLIIILAIYATNLAHAVILAQDNPITLRTWASLRASTSSDESPTYTIPVPDIYLCVPAPVNNRFDDPPLIFLKGVYEVEVVTEGAVGCWDPEDRDCRKRLIDSLFEKDIFLGSTVFAKNAVALQFLDNVSSITTTNKDAALHIMVMTLERPINPFNKEGLIPPVSAMLKLADRRSESRPVGGNESYDYACEARGSQNAWVVTPAGTYMGSYHEVRTYGRNVDHAIGAPLTYAYHIDSMQQISERNFNSSELNNFLQYKDEYQSWLREMDPRQSRLLQQRLMEERSRVKVLEFYLTYHVGMEVERKGLSETYTWGMALGSVAGLLSTGLSSITGLVLVLFGIMRWMEKRSIGISYTPHDLD